MSKKAIVGMVERSDGKKNIVVRVSYTKRHPRYRKVMRRSRKFTAENSLGAAVGDKIVITESRPLSRNKHFIVSRIFGKQK